MSIASRIESISEHLENAYDSLEDLGIDLTAVNKNLENLSVELKEVYNDYPKVSGEGISISLTSTKKGKITTSLKGNLSQNTTTGKNQMENQRATTTVNGVTFTHNSDGSITLNGTATANFDFIFTNAEGSGTNNQNLSADTYILTGVTDGSSSTYYLQAAIYDGSSTDYNSQFTTPKSFTVAADSTFRCFIVVKSGTSFSNKTIYPMIRPSSFSDDSYEPYTNGQSPNPTFPQEISVVTGENQINIEGKNLANVPSSYSVTLQDNISVHLEAGTYTFSASDIVTDSTQNVFLMQLYKKNGGSAQSQYVYFDTKKATFTIDSEVNTIRIYSSNNYNDSVGKTTTFTNLMIEKGSEATTYEAYQGQSYLVDLGAENLLQIKNTTRTINGITFTPQEDGSILINGTATAKATYPLNKDSESTGRTIPLEANTSYIISKTSDKNLDDIIFQVWYLKNNSSNYSTNSLTTAEATDLGAYLRIDSGVTINNVKIYCQLEKGTQAHAYTPYGQQIQLCKWDDNEDSISKDNGKWYWNRYIGISKFMGTSDEQWGTDGELTNTRRFKINTNDYFPNSLGMSYSKHSTSNYFRWLVNYNADTPHYYIGDSITIFFIEKTIATTLNQFKDWLKGHHLYSYYKYKIPVSTEITHQPLIDQLNALEKAMSYNNQTNITQTNTNLPFTIIASVLKNS